MSLSISPIHEGSTPVAKTPNQQLSDCFDQAVQLFQKIEKYFNEEGNAALQSALQAGAQTNVQLKFQDVIDFPLHRALSFDFPIGTVEILLKDGQADPLLRDGQGKSAFFRTISIEKWVLMQQYAQVNHEQILAQRSTAGDSIVTNIVESYSESEVSLQAIDFWKAQGARIPQDVIEKKPRLLYGLCQSGLYPKMVQRMLEMGYPALTDDLYIAIMNRKMTFVQLLLSHKVTFNDLCWRRLIDRLDPMDDDHRQLARSILKEVDPTPFGWSPLHFAARFGMNEELPPLLQKFNIDSPCSDARQTSLHLAACNDHWYSAFLLLEVGQANPSILDSEGEMPHHMVPNNPINELIRIYREPGDRKARILKWVADTQAQTLDSFKQVQNRDNYAAKIYPKRLKDLAAIRARL